MASRSLLELASLVGLVVAASCTTTEPKLAPTKETTSAPGVTSKSENREGYTIFCKGGDATREYTAVHDGVRVHSTGCTENGIGTDDYIQFEVRCPAHVTCWQTLTTLAERGGLWRLPVVSDVPESVDAGPEDMVCLLRAFRGTHKPMMKFPWRPGSTGSSDFDKFVSFLACEQRATTALCPSASSE